MSQSIILCKKHLHLRTTIALEKPHAYSNMLLETIADMILNLWQPNKHSQNSGKWKLFWFLSKDFFSNLLLKIIINCITLSNPIFKRSVLNLKDLSKILSSQSSTKNTAKLVASEKRLKAMWRALLVLVKRIFWAICSWKLWSIVFIQAIQFSKICPKSQRSVLNFEFSVVNLWDWWLA